MIYKAVNSSSQFNVLTAGIQCSNSKLTTAVNIPPPNDPNFLHPPLPHLHSKLTIKILVWVHACSSVDSYCFDVHSYLISTPLKCSKSLSKALVLFLFIILVRFIDCSTMARTGQGKTREARKEKGEKPCEIYIYSKQMFLFWKEQSENLSDEYDNIFWAA